jgi:hypothetical protein
MNAVGVPMQRITRCFQVLLLLLLFHTLAQSQQSESVHEIWPEVDIYIPLAEKFRLFLLASEEKGAEGGTSHKAHIGIHLDYFRKKKWTLRAGYRYGFDVGEGDPFKEHRFLLEETYSKPLPRRFDFHFRSRQEFREVNGDFSMRFRERLRLERDYGFGKRSLVPYASGEVYYDTRYDTFNRFRLIAGVQFFFKKRDAALLKVRKQKVIDLYYAWQHDSRANPERVDALGIRFAVHF